MNWSTFHNRLDAEFRTTIRSAGIAKTAKLESCLLL